MKPKIATYRELLSNSLGDEMLGDLSIDSAIHSIVKSPLDDRGKYRAILAVWAQRRLYRSGEKAAIIRRNLNAGFGYGFAVGFVVVLLVAFLVLRLVLFLR